MKTSTVKRMVFVALLAVVPNLQAAAQDWKSILKGVASAVEEKASEKIAEKIDTLMITGAWNYVRPDIKLESDDLLSKAGSEIAAKKAEEQLLDVLTKIGINENTVFTFNADSTYAMRTDKRTFQGTYSLNKQTREVVLTSRLKVQFTAEIDQKILKPNEMTIRFKAEKLMALVKHVSGTLAQKSTNKSVALVNSLLNKYDGLKLGVELKRQ